MSDFPTWERRFRAPLLAFPAWATDAPDRLVMASTESGSYQLHTWDRATGERRQVTDDPVGVLEGRPTRDGTGVIWFHDATGAESGSYVIAPFDEHVAPEPLIEGLPEGWTEGLAIGRTRTIAGAEHRGRVLGLDVGARRRRAQDPRAPRARATRRRLGPDQRGRPPGPLGRRVDRRARGHGGRRRAPPLAPLHRRAPPARPSPTSATTGCSCRATPSPRSPATRGSPSPTSGPARSARPCGMREAARSSTCRSTSRARWSRSTGGPTDRRCCCSSSRTADTTCIATTSRAARSRRSTRSPARSPRPPSGPTARSGTASTTGCIRRRCSRSARRRRCSSPPARRPPPAGRSSRGGSRTRTASASTGSSSARRATARTR